MNKDPNGFTDGLNVYAFITNNPINLIDPFGLWTIQIGISGTYGLKFGGTAGVGIVFGYGDLVGWQFGFYSVGGGGPYVGGGTSGVLDVSWSRNPCITDLQGLATTVGGSGKLPIPPPGPSSFGGEINYHWSGAKTSYTGSVGYGVGTPEGHTFVTATDVYEMWRSR